MSAPSHSRRRLVAVLALLALAAAVAAAVVSLTDQSLGRLAIAAVALAVAVAGGWYAIANRGIMRAVGALVAAAALLALIVLLLTSFRNGLALELALVLVGVALVAARYALDPGDDAAASTSSTQVGPAQHPVLIMNPWSGGGKVDRFHLVEECQKRGIEPVLLKRGDDLLQLAEDAVARGADVIGMAGGDGSQALVASVASRHNVPHVCIPAGTRNHFALDLGLDRDDVVAALDAFGDAVERRIDLATVNGNVFVNNASMGVYARIVQSPEYRDAKLKTAAAMLPDMLGADAEPFDLHFTGPDGAEMASVQMLLVSNDPYQLDHIDGRGTRPRLDAGTLGIATAHVANAHEAVEFTGLETAGRIRSFSGWSEWEAATFRIDSGGPIEIGVDGEAQSLQPPLVFESHPGSLRIRVPTHARGGSPSARALPTLRGLVPALVAVAMGEDPQ